jgi:FKBP-type peptidyl-prolyl cis-trans isomerase
MNKLSILIFIISITACVSNVETKPEKSLGSVPGEEEVGDLYKEYSANPANRFQEEKNLLIEYATDNGLIVVGTPSGLYYEIEDIGTGPYIQHGDALRVHYTGKFLDGKEFDSSYGRGEPLAFKVGEMIPAWNEGLSFMKRGDKATLLVPSRIAYGSKGFPGYVPPYTPLVFELEVLE